MVQFRMRARFELLAQIQKRSVVFNDKENVSTTSSAAQSIYPFETSSCALVDLWNASIARIEKRYAERERERETYGNSHNDIYTIYTIYITGVDGA